MSTQPCDPPYTPDMVDPGGARIPSIEDRMPAQRLGVAVVEALVNVIVTGQVAPGETLPPEVPLAKQFGVSRTVLRESVKRLEEKGLVSVGQGRGTTVQPTRSWNMMDRVVLTALIAHDETLGVLDELSIVRARLEAAMAADTARVRTAEELAALRDTLGSMRASLDDPATFGAADVRFHDIVMEISGNRLAESIARSLFERARDSARYHGTTPPSFHDRVGWTVVPRPWPTDTSPFSSSRLTDSRRTVRLTPNCFASGTSGGSVSPGAT